MAPEAADQTTAPSRIRPAAKIVAYVAAWLVALLATNPSGSFWALAYLFPLGLAAFVNLRWGNDGGWGVLGICVGIYVLHAIYYFRSKTALSTWVLLGTLVLLLVCNVSGCRAQLPR